MSTPESNPETGKAQDVPARFRLAPSRNQKQRSKLKQAAEETIADEPKPAPEPPKPAPEPAVRRAKLKRSGQMHDDLTGPMPPDPNTRDEPEY